MTLKPFEQITQAEHTILSLIMATNPEVELARMLLISYLREQKGDINYLSELEGLDENKVRNGGNIIQNMLYRRFFDELNEQENSFLKSLITFDNYWKDKKYTFAEFVKYIKNAHISHFYKDPEDCEFTSLIWQPQLTPFGYSYKENLNNLQNLFKYPFEVLKNKDVLVTVKNSRSEKDTFDMASIIAKTSQLYSNVYFNFNIENNSILTDLFHTNFTANNASECKKPLIKIVVDWQSIYWLKKAIAANYEYSERKIDDKWVEEYIYNNNPHFSNFLFVIKMTQYTKIQEFTEAKKMIEKMETDFLLKEKNINFDIIIPKIV